MDGFAVSSFLQIIVLLLTFSGKLGKVEALNNATNKSQLIIFDSSAPLFSDPDVRIHDSSSCGEDYMPGSVVVTSQGTELHEPDSRTWHWSDIGTVKCSSNSQCIYGRRESTYWCRTEPGDDAADRLNCECQQCPCPPGKGGFSCSTCISDEGCGDGKHCLRSGLVSADIDKKFTCSFSQSWRRQNSYRLFWSDGWAQPQAFVQWQASDSMIHLDFTSNMCTRQQPILFQCACRECSVYRDSLDSLTNELSGICSDKSLPSPCARCKRCTCTYPPDSQLGFLPRQILKKVKGGVNLGCEDSGNLSRCVTVLDDLPMKMEFDCLTGACTDKEEIPAIIQSSGSFNWTTMAALSILGTFVFSFLVLAQIGFRYVCKRRYAITVPVTSPQTVVRDDAPTTPGRKTPLILRWKDVSCTRGGKQVLQNESGSLKTSRDGKGCLVAVVGPSGCGKTTLLEALAGKVVSGDHGQVSINGKMLSPALRREHISFVHQDDMLGASMTVREVLDFSASLRLRGLSAKKRAGRVSWVLSQLQLEAVQHTRIGDGFNRGISGGERRRLAIGVELLVSPAVMILDEPTTGLDASTALSLGKVLAALAEDGRLMLCSLHQPRPELLSLFHQKIDLDRHVCRLSGLPEERNPGEIEALHLSAPSPASPESVADDSVTGSHISLCCGSTNATGPLASVKAVGAKPASFPVQVFELWRRSLVESSRGQRGDLWALVVVIGIGLFVGFAFRDLKNSIEGVQNRFGSIFFMQLFFAFFGMKACSSWYVDGPRFERERSSHLYTASAYYVAKASAYLWWYCLLLPLVFVGISYTLIGYKASGPTKPLTFFLCIAGTMASASGLSLLCLSTSSSSASGMSSSAICLTVMLMYSGFLQRRNAIPPALRWLVDISPFGHSFAAMISSELGGLETVVDAEGYTPVNIQGEIWLYQFDINMDDLPRHIEILSIFTAVVWLFTFLSIARGWYRTSVSLLPDVSCVRSAKAHAAPTVTSERSLRPQASGPLVWQDLSVVLPNGKQIYDGFSGVASVGKSLALLGPSGCGKTTLLACLAGDSNGVSVHGRVFVGNQEMSQGELMKTVGYVRQDDALHAELSVAESIAFAAALRLPHATKTQQAARVHWTLQRLGLVAVADSRIGGEKGRGISGGERRRTAVGVELVASRGILVLDEPTSGLDEASAFALGRLLKELAEEGCIILASLHQPSKVLLACFEDVLALAPEGKVAYFGATSRLAAAVDLLSSKPTTSSASDAILDLIAGDDAEKACAAFKASVYHQELMEKVRKAKATSFSRAGSPKESSSRTAHAAKDELQSLSLPPLLTQLQQLLLRELRISIRDRCLAAYHYGGALVAGLLLGFTYYQMPFSVGGVISRIGFFFAAQCILGMQALQGLMAWRPGHASFLRERKAGYYSTGAFVLAKVLVDWILLRVGPPALMCLVTYQLAGLQAGREAVCCLGFCLASITSSAFCLALGSIAPRSTAILPLAVLIILLFLLFGGVLLARAPAFFAYISYFRASYHMLVANEFQGQSFKFDPNGLDADFKDLSGEEWMRLLHIESRPVQEQAAWLIGWAVVYVLCTWTALVLQTTRISSRCPYFKSKEPEAAEEAFVSCLDGLISPTNMANFVVDKDQDEDALNLYLHSASTISGTLPPPSGSIPSGTASFPPLRLGPTAGLEKDAVEAFKEGESVTSPSALQLADTRSDDETQPVEAPLESLASDNFMQS